MKYAAEGLEFTFVKDETTLKGTVTSGAFTFLEMEAGEWSVTLQTMGMTLNLGNLLIDPDQTEISLDAAIAKVFPNLSSEYTGQIDLANGAFEYLGADKPNMMMNVGGISQGDAYFAAKISMTQEDLDKVLGQGGEIQFSIALTVNGATRETGFWLSGRESKAGLRTDFNWDEGGCHCKLCGRHVHTDRVRQYAYRRRTVARCQIQRVHRISGKSDRRRSRQHEICQKLERYGS